MMKKKAFLIILYFYFAACSENKKEPQITFEIKNETFEGEIILKEKNYDWTTEIRFLISENKIRREEISSKGWPTESKAGIIINLENNTIIQYLEDYTYKRKLVQSVDEYKKSIINNVHVFPTSITTYDDFYLHLKYYNRLLYKKEMLDYKKLKFDYNVYVDKKYRQDIFDSKDIKVNPKFLPLIFINIPKNVPFPVMYKLTASKDDTYKTDSLHIDLEEDSSLFERVNGFFTNTNNSEQNLEALIQRKIDDKEFELENKDYVLYTDNSFFRLPGGGGSDD